MIRGRLAAGLTRARRLNDAALLGACLAVGLVLRLLLFVRATTPDGQRFLQQAADLSAGLGFRLDGRPTASLPPGYPAWIALLARAGVPAEAQPLVNLLLSLATVAALYLAVRPAGRRAAGLAALVWAANPWAARQVGYVTSEPLAAGLCAALVWQLSRGARPGGPGGPFACGLLLAALALTAPSTIVLALGLGLAAASAWRARPRALAALAAGLALPMVPWQLHCLRATGRFQPAVFTPTHNLTSGRGLWVRTWLVREAELRFLWHPEELTDAPPRAFRSAEERREILTLASDASAPGAARLEARLGQVAQERRAERPWAGPALTLFRAILLWTDMPSIAHVQAEWVGRVAWSRFEAERTALGAARARARLFKGLACTAAQGLYLLLPAFFLWIAAGALRARRRLALAIVAGVAAYTLVSAYTALGEARRNTVFHPALLYLIALRGEPLQRVRRANPRRRATLERAA